MDTIASVTCFMSILFGVQHADLDIVRWAWRNRHYRGRRQIRLFHEFWRDVVPPWTR